MEFPVGVGVLCWSWSGVCFIGFDAITVQEALYPLHHSRPIVFFQPTTQCQLRAAPHGTGWAATDWVDADWNEADGPNGLAPNGLAPTGLTMVGLLNLL